MALDLGMEEQLFKHSAEFDQGGGKVRIGQATVVVALDGTGDTDDIQEGINMLPSTGGGVFIKEGTYNLGAKLTITKSNVELTGIGYGTIISRNDAILEIGDGTNAYSGFLFRNITFKGGSTLAKLGITIKDFVTDTLIKGCQLLNIWGGPIIANGTSIARIILSENYFKGCLVLPVSFTSAHECQVVNNIFATSKGINFLSCNYMIFSCNILKVVGQVRFNQCNRCTCNGNNCNDITTTNSLWIDDTDYSIFDGNFMHQGEYAGIRVTDNSEHNVISNNIIINTDGATAYGILLDAATASSIVIGNVCTGSATAQITDNGANTLVNNIVV